MKEVSIWTDGACKGNPGLGGWGALLVYEGGSTEIYGGERDTTNNRMEIMAVIQALALLKERCLVHVYTDSQYVQKGMTEWISGWKKCGWRTAAKKPVKNADLWKALDGLCQQHQLQWHWVKGHSGDIGNERADELANLGVAKLQAYTPHIQIYYY